MSYDKIEYQRMLRRNKRRRYIEKRRKTYVCNYCQTKISKELIDKMNEFMADEPYETDPFLCPKCLYDDVDIIKSTMGRIPIFSTRQRNDYL